MPNVEEETARPWRKNGMMQNRTFSLISFSAVCAFTILLWAQAKGTQQELQPRGQNVGCWSFIPEIPEPVDPEATIMFVGSQPSNPKQIYRFYTLGQMQTTQAGHAYMTWMDEERKTHSVQVGTTTTLEKTNPRCGEDTQTVTQICDGAFSETCSIEIVYKQDEPEEPRHMLLKILNADGSLKRDFEFREWH